ncbi:MAG: UDP-glucose 4-epimerase GalE [Candidatus Nealsonbacteria bacterium]|nr:UDP-glucose 4-epimerase GalE [Candidatus Nealsonbacteria bacterium]
MAKKHLKILVTGGAGFIGSHLINKLLLSGFKVYSIDNHDSPEQKINKKCVFIKGSILSRRLLNNFFKKNSIDVVIHLAALIRVDESQKYPQRYFKNNVQGGVCLLNAMKDFNIDKMVFASSAAVYGKPKGSLIIENDNLNPHSVYGLTKMKFEEILAQYNKNYGIKSVSLRIFNASGADPSGKFKERHKPETHLIPNALKSLRFDKPIIVFGNDYSTKDGTCMRDYIHVNDISGAFILAIPRLINNQASYESYNLSSAKGYSVKQIIDLCSVAMKKDARVLFKDRREGDSPFLVANNLKIKKELNWKPKYAIKEIISHTISSLF